MSRTAILAIVLVELSVPLAGRAQESLEPSEKVARRVAALRDQFTREAADNTGRLNSEKRTDLQTTIDALIAIIREESAKPYATALGSWALEALAHYPDNRDAVRALVDNIDYGSSPAPLSFTSSPLEHHPAARELIQCGKRARTSIYTCLSASQSERRLHIMAYVLWQIDQDAHRTSSVQLTVLRLTREIEWTVSTKHQDDETRIKNLRRMIEIMLDPRFSSAPFPPPTP